MIWGAGVFPIVTKWPIKKITIKFGVYLVCTAHQLLKQNVKQRMSERSPDGSRCLGHLC